MPVFGNVREPVSFVDGMTLLSSLGMTFAMLCASLALRRRKKPEPELPKIKDPVVVKPQEPAAENTDSVVEAVSLESSSAPVSSGPEPVSDIPAAEATAEETAAAVSEESSLD